LRVLILGSGAREHTIAWAFAKSKRISGLFIAPGNAGTETVGVNCPDVDPLDFDKVIRLCLDKDINLVFVGPEAPLAAGIVDRLEKENIPVIGPHAKAARLEASKIFSKAFMESHEIPTASAREYSDWDQFQKDMKGLSGKVVIKKNGLAAGKGVLESGDISEILSFGRNILENDSLLVEEFLEGYEVSIFTFTDGKDYLTLPVCSDYKKAHEDDTGPNTGGMGAICPVPWIDSEGMREIEEKIVKPTFIGLKEDGIGYKGILYFGLMITANGPRILEYNVRLGDPECQVLLPLIASDFCNLMDAVQNQSLESFPLSLKDQAAVGVVVASGGYPAAYRKGLPVRKIPSATDTETLIFHASTGRDRDGQVITGGGRCFTAVGVDRDILSASRKAYQAAGQIHFKGAWYRSDIGKKYFLE
jgi:phosphoribosylamine--glycine ligase